ncbi:MAG TPA: type II secretion system F family protein [Acidobacteriaceae bacterium]|nr:type II secretion system F family protein [Acidobacteriaceae bacterium]
MTELFYFAVAGTLFLGVLFLASLVIPTNSGSTRRVLQVTVSAEMAKIRPRRSQRLQQSMLGLVRWLRAKIGLAEGERLRQRFLNAGLRGPGPVEKYFAAQMLGPVAAIALASFIRSNTFLWVAALATLAYLAPDFWLDHAVKARRERIRRSVPDAVDLLVICVDAGLGLDQAMLRVGVELSISHPEINEEFLQINREQRAGKPRMEAWQSMADRTNLREIASFTSMLSQTEKFGTPIARALSVFADGMRQERRQRAEELAAKTTVKMIFPLVLFIFPSMFIVLLAPAVLSIGRGLTGLAH